MASSKPRSTESTHDQSFGDFYETGRAIALKDPEVALFADIGIEVYITGIDTQFGQDGEFPGSRNPEDVVHSHSSQHCGRELQVSPPYEEALTPHGGKQQQNAVGIGFQQFQKAIFGEVAADENAIATLSRIWKKTLYGY